MYYRPSDSKLYLANLGDSRALMCTAQGTFQQLSNDHKPLDTSEMNRIYRSGGFVSEGGRVNGMLAVARALMARPRLLMMDEPSLGLAPLVVEQIFQIVQGLNREGITVLLVEQNARLALSIAHHAYLLEQGRIAFHGTPSEVSANEGISRAYLGIKGG